MGKKYMRPKEILTFSIPLPITHRMAAKKTAGNKESSGKEKGV